MDDLLKEAKDAFELCVAQEADNRAQALDDIRFARLAEQWPSEVRRARELDNRPCLTINRLPAFIRQVVNDARQNRPAIKVHPADDQADPQVAQIYNGLIRNIEYASDADVAYDTALDAAVTSGLGYFRINTRYATDDSFDQDIVIQRVADPFCVYGDPYSTAADSADWNIAFVIDLMPKARFAGQYKGADAVDWDGLGYGALCSPWLDDERVMAAEYWVRHQVRRQILALSNGEMVAADEYARNKALFDTSGVSVVGRPREVISHQVRQHVLTGAEVLDTVDWAGRFIPIVPVYGDEVFLEGRRHLRSLVRDAKDPQRMFNYWRTTSTELVALAPRAPFIGPKGAFKSDADKWASANTESHAYIEYDGQVPPERQAFAGVPAGALQEALNASDDIKSILGLYDASLGAASNENSGRAILARQREGDVSTFHFIDNLSRAIRHAGRIMIDLIPQVYSTPRLLRVLGPGGEASTVAVNQPGQALPGAAPLAAVFDLSVGKYDLTVEAGPSFTTRREEAANQMIALIQAFPQAAPVLGDLLAKNLDWPGADEIAERLKILLPPQLQGGEGGPTAAVAQQVQALQQQLAALQGARDLQTQKLNIEQFRAGTERMEAVHKLQTPAG
ncbi:MAG TPA: portal protein [Caulobacteraceae bacterium]|nr:portal protein [Caulobacteraceae bacterium]